MTLSEWLHRSGMTQAALAQRCGVHPVTVAKWKAGTMTPRPAQMDALLGVTGGRVTAADFQVQRGFAEAQATLGGAPGLDDAVVAEARSLGVDVEAVCEAALAAAIRAEKGRRWAEDNREAIAAHNDWVEKHGVPLAKYRMF